MDVDEAQSKLGRYGRYQVLYYVIICLATNIPACWHMLATFFHGIVPDHHCRVPPGVESTSEAVNRSAIPSDVSDPYVRQCFVYVNGSNVTEKCSASWNEWEYSGDVTDTIVSKWDLVCDKSYMVKMSQSILVFGVMTGAMVFSTLGDVFGRKPTFLLCQWLLVIVGVTNAYVDDIFVYLVLRFLAGALQQGLVVIGTIMVCELFSAKQRTFAGIIIENFWAACTCALAVLSYLIPNWRHLQLLISLSGILTIPLYWILPESVPWLCANDCFEEAEAILRRAAKMNGIVLPSDIFRRRNPNDDDDDQGEKTKMQILANGEKDSTDPERTKTKKTENFIARYRRLRHQRSRYGGGQNTNRYTLLDLIRHPMLRTHAAVMGSIWLVITYVYYGITLNTKDLAGNRYLNFFLTGLVEIPAYTISFFVIKTWGRRLPLLGFHILAGVPLIITAFISEAAGGTGLFVLKTVCVMIGKFGITASFGIVFLYSPELFPTTLRSQGTGISSFCGRIGNMIAPFATALDVFAPWLSAVVFGTVSVAGGLLVLILPETLNRPLPQSIEEIEQWTTTTTTTGKSSAIPAQTTTTRPRFSAGVVMETEGDVTDPFTTSAKQNDGDHRL